jgi:hypothetical protein
MTNTAAPKKLTAAERSRVVLSSVLHVDCTTRGGNGGNGPPFALPSDERYTLCSETECRVIS